MVIASTLAPQRRRNRLIQMPTHSIERLFSEEGFMPHGMCYLWQPDVLALHVISDGLITVAYMTIPLTLVHFVRKRPGLQFNWMFLCFSIFIVACGVTHWMEIWTIWHATYWLSGGIKAVTALASVVTAVLLVKLVPFALRLPGPAQLQFANLELLREVRERTRAEESLQQANATLEIRVIDRTAELEALNRTLKQDSVSLALAAEAAGLGFWQFDPMANVFHWDAAMFGLYGCPPVEEAQTYSRWVDTLHPDDRARCVQEWSNALQGGAAFDTEFRIIQPNGAVRHLRASARKLPDGDGSTLRMFGVNFDITDTKRADERFRLAIDAAPTGMLLMDSAGRIVLVNTQIEALFGYSRDELLGRPVEMLVPERFRQRHPSLRQGFFGAPKARLMGAGRDLFGLRQDGSEMPVEIGLNPLRTSAGEFVLSSIVDLTQRREIERMRNDFVSTVSHELRTPLTSISGALGLLQTGALGALPEEAAAMVQIAFKNSGRLVRLINDILDAGKLEADQLVLHMTSVPLGELLLQSVEANVNFADKYGVRFLLEASPMGDRVMADPDRLMQVVTNLLSNAAKFSPRGSDVRIRLLPGQKATRIEVADSGPGIPDTFRGRIFEKFAQADASTTRHHEGSGLGLNIARKLIEAMGGSIGFITKAGEGTTFYLELPRVDGASPSSAQVQAAASMGRSTALARGNAAAPGTVTVLPRLLYVEDDEDLISVIAATLAGRADVVAARGIHEAERLLGAEKFDLVILDQTLPDGDGLALVDRIPRLVGQWVPIVILSVNDIGPEMREKVATVLVKSQTSAPQVAAAILSCLPLLHP